MGGVWVRGCSFSFGEGLQYFSKLPTVIIPEQHYFDYFELTHAQYRFIQNHRYSKLLADKLGTFDINVSTNGGTHNRIFFELENLYKGDFKKTHKSYQSELSVNLNEIDVIVIQFTNLFRDKVEIDGVIYPEICAANSTQDWIERFIETNMSLEEFTSKVANKLLNEFEDLLRKIEKKKPNIKIRVLSWEDQIVPFLKNNQYFSDKFVSLEYKGKTYDCFNDMIYDNTGLTIQETFYPKCANDLHFNMEWHELVAESIFKTL